MSDEKDAEEAPKAKTTATVTITAGPIVVSFETPEAKAVWAAVQRAAREVAKWPAWKRGNR